MQGEKNSSLHFYQKNVKSYLERWRAAILA